TQERPDVAVSSDGTFLVVWQDASRAPPDTSVSAIRGRRLQRVGTAPGFLDPVDFVVNDKKPTGQTLPAVAAAPDGSFVVVWQDLIHTSDASGAGVRLRRVGADGVPVGTDVQVNALFSGGDQDQPDIAMSPDGTYLVVYRNASSFSPVIVVRPFDAFDLPTGLDTQLQGPNGADLTEPAIAFGLGTYVVVWNDGNIGTDAAPSGIRGRRLQPSGGPAGAEIQVNSTTAGAQTQPAIGAAAGDSFVIAWTDASAAAPDSKAQAIRARRLLSDDSFDAPDTVVNTTVAGAQVQPALPPSADTALLIAWASPDGSSRGVRGRTLLVACPQPNETDYYADPLANRTGMPAPTGARSPAVCAYPTLTEALAQASAAAAIAGVSARAIASADTRGPLGTVDFQAETFPWQVPTRVVVTTTDDPAVGGAGLDPTRFAVLVEDHTVSGPASVRLLAAPSRTAAGGAMRGLTLSQLCTGCPAIAIKVEGFGDPSTPRLERVQVNSGSTWTTGVEVRGDGVLAETGASGFTGQGLHIVNDGGTSASDRVVVSGGVFEGNVVGLLVSGGQVELDGPTVEGSPVDLGGSGGDGLVIRDWRPGPGGSLVVVPSSLTASGVIADGNADDGILVDLVDPASTALLDASTSASNGGDGVRVLRAPHADAALDGIAGLTEYGFTLSASSITGNSGDGVSLGSTSAQTQPIAAMIGGLGVANDIAGNGGAGLSIRQSAAVGPCPSDGVTACTGATIHNNLVHDNGGPGVELDTALLVPLYRPGIDEPSLGFVSNEVFHNSMAGAGCSVAQSQPQILIVGPTAMSQGVCDDQLSQSACQAQSSDPANNNHCLWNQGAGSCTVGWDLRGDVSNACNSGHQNAIFDYNTSDAGNFLSVGIRAINNSSADASNNIWRSSDITQNVTMAPGSIVVAALLCSTFGSCSS
ncbi:MAG TPA: right-handed parallel beta-helix repeat-containing protein, partial [Kofleriaceae bacterium]|nr:right-handed parallel beta-helix repeat-containing protein [Kofleriaceae bacterium]